MEFLRVSEDEGKIDRNNRAIQNQRAVIITHKNYQRRLQEKKEKEKLENDKKEKEKRTLDEDKNSKSKEC